MLFPRSFRDKLCVSVIGLVARNQQVLDKRGNPV